MTTDFSAYSAALYIRLSKEDENSGPSESVTNQKSLLEEFVRKNNISVYDIYTDDGWSGTNFDRPAFTRMLCDIEAGHVNMVITKDLSRLGRDYIMTGHYMERYFPENKIRYISLLDGIDTGTESAANDITPFRAIMNDMYAKDISKKIRSVKHDKQRKGLFIGGKPAFGYKMHPTEKNKIIIDETAALVVRHIFSMAAHGMSCRKIAETLNEEHIPTPSAYCGKVSDKNGFFSGLWSGERVSEMLQNETYIGNMVQGRTVKISYKSKKYIRQARENWIVVENTHEPLISREIFQKANLLLASRRRTRNRTYDFLLKGIIFCHECSQPLSVLNRPAKPGEDRLFFVCRTYQRFAKDGSCTCHSIKEKTVTDAVISTLREICIENTDADMLRLAAVSALDEIYKNRENEISYLQTKLRCLRTNMDKIYFDRLNGLLDEGTFQRIYQKLKSEQTAFEGKLKKSEQESSFPSDKIAENSIQQFWELAFSDRTFIVSLVERVELTEDRRIIIKLRFCNPKTDN